MDLFNIQRILEHQFQFSFRTGNVILDTMLAGLILTATTYLFSSLRNVSMNYDYFLSLLGINYNKIIIKGKPIKMDPKNDMEKADFSIKFKAILHQVKLSGYSNSGVHQLVEGADTNSASDQFIVAQTTTFTLGPEIYCKIIQEAKDTFRDEKDKISTFRAEISSKTKTVEELEMLIKFWIKEYSEFVLKTGENMIELTGRIINGFDQTFDFSNKFLAVLHKMNKLSYNSPHIKKLRELQVKEPKPRYGNDTPEDEKRKAESLVPEVCQIEDNVSCRVEWAKNNREATEYSIQIASEVLTVQQLSELLNTWEKEYDEHNQVGDGLKYFVFNPSTENTKNHFYTEFTFESVKSFKNVFFPEKESLIEKIEFFQKNEVWFAERGIPYTLGLLFHGEPGCGKTSTIKSIANLTQRHIISVPLKNVKTASDLYNIFYGTKINNRSIPMNKRLYVLEDIDCGGLEDVVKKRRKRVPKPEEDTKEDVSEDNDDNNESDDDKKKITLTDILEIKKGGEKEKEDKKELTLSDLLEVFDGVMESKGRMMVITTNHIDKLDPALIRPGRVDTCIQFGKCKPEAVMSIFQNFYGQENLPESFDSKQVPDETLTPAEVVQIFVNNSATPCRGLQVICAEQ
eukprot:GFUD01038880.1.p1 GENE.GFUD01038880.1~~GFUD01038880.1.p1  ORF type:complete len:628 (+),score=164.89 GFUD01038880.1:60-1943(+)